MILSGSLLMRVLVAVKLSIVAKKSYIEIFYTGFWLVLVLNQPQVFESVI